MARTSGKRSAGLLMFSRRGGAVRVLLVHPGGPFFRKKDAGAWTIPKGEIEAGDEPLATAVREFREETGIEPREPFLELGTVTQPGGKTVHAWAFECDDLPEQPPPSNTFTMEWPPRSGRQQEFPEIDRAECFDLETAAEKINPAQVALLERLGEVLEGQGA